ncbi:MAG: hypothetical protein GY754_17495 [bacterium]|nr:hypothetical protein [bacterium]
MFKKYLKAVLLSSIFIYSGCFEYGKRVPSPLVESKAPASVIAKGKSIKSNYAFMKMDRGLFQKLKQRIESDDVAAISDFPLTPGKGTTITNIQKVETFARHTAIYHGYKRIHRKPNLVVVTGEIEESGDSIFLALTPQGAQGYTRNAVGGIKRVITHSPKDSYILSYDAHAEDFLPSTWKDAALQLPGAPDVITSVNGITSKTLSSGNSNGLDYYRIAVETTAGLVDEFDGDTEAAENYILTLFAAVSPMFNEFNAHLYVSYLRLWPDGNDGYADNGINDLLTQFRERWSTESNPEYAIERHSAIMLSELVGGGLAWVNSICNKNAGYAVAGINGNFTSPLEDHSSGNWDAIVLAHELGHTFGSPHTHSYDPPIDGCGLSGDDKDCSQAWGGTIMSYCHACSGGITNFVMHFHPTVVEYVDSLRSPETDNCVPLTAPGDDPSASINIESGEISVQQQDRDQWTSVNLANTFENPVVIMQVVTNNGGQPVTTRLRNITESSFQFQVQEWDYLDGTHSSETLNYFVMEAGTFELSDGSVLQAGTGSVGSTKETIAFPGSFSDTPVVLSQVQTNSDSTAAVTRQDDITINGFSLYLQSEENLGKTHGSEAVGWIALSQGTLALDNGMELSAYILSGDFDNPETDVEEWYYRDFVNQAFAETPVLFAAMQSTNGTDTTGFRMRNISTASFEFFLEEEQSKDDEIKHAAETVGYLGILPASQSFIELFNED